MNWCATSTLLAVCGFGLNLIATSTLAQSDGPMLGFGTNPLPPALTKSLKRSTLADAPVWKRIMNPPSTFGALLLTLAIGAANAQDRPMDCSNSLQTVLPSPQEDPTAYIEFTSSCKEVPLESIDEDLMRRWKRGGGDVKIRRYTLTIKSTVRTAIKIDESHAFSQYALQLEGFSLNIGEGSTAIMSFVSPHPPLWKTQTVTLFWPYGGKTVKDKGKDVATLLPTWIYHVSDPIRFEYSLTSEAPLIAGQDGRRHPIDQFQTHAASASLGHPLQRGGPSRGWGTGIRSTSKAVRAVRERKSVDD